MLHVIEVQYDGESKTLSLVDPNQREISLQSTRDRVQWLVKSCPNDAFPRVRFLVDEKQRRGLGPFNGLRQSPSYLLSDGVLGRAGEVYRYQLKLYHSGTNPLDPSVVLATLPNLSLVKEVSGESTGLTMIVRPEGEGSLVVEPEDVDICKGDSVQWVFKGISQKEDWVPRVQFYKAPEGSHLLNLHFGPFASLSVTEDRVIGTASNGMIGGYKYVVQTVNVETGNPARSKIIDPGMGNDGDPPGGAGP